MPPAKLRYLSQPDSYLIPWNSLAPQVNSQSSGARSRCFLNGAATSLRVLRELGALIVDSNSQHASIGLRDPATQLALLDAVAGTSAQAQEVSPQGPA